MLIGAALVLLYKLIRDGKFPRPLRIGRSDLYARSEHVGEVTIHANTGRIAGSKLSKPIAQRISQVREGLPISELNTLANVLRISRDQLAGILGVTTRTLQRKAEADDRLRPVASDRLARVECILLLATEVTLVHERAFRFDDRQL